jgi:hypothetical protein
MMYFLFFDRPSRIFDLGEIWQVNISKFYIYFRLHLIKHCWYLFDIFILVINDTYLHGYSQLNSTTTDNIIVCIQIKIDLIPFYHYNI